MNVALWDVIRDFFVSNIFGGMTSSHEIFKGFMGRVYATGGANAWMTDTATLGVYSAQMDDRGFPISSLMSIGDWLSSMATLITLIFLVIFLGLFVRWIFRLFSGLLSRA